ncbi:MAG: indole-3-glycerol phosphate synthase TrpC, partial [Anaerolineae bacterium]|nr:indole-3-glycerol phosphate synthase TrpC [Anaerolineae bacterium]
MTVLSQILELKRAEVAARRAQLPESELRARLSDMPPTRGFMNALRHTPNPIALIAEVKRASPSKGVIRAEFDPLTIATRYYEAGADALSILTDQPYFGGRLEYLALIRPHVPLPLLRKDFIIDPYQIYESRLMGADAILLIVAAIESDAALREWHELAESLGLDALVEVHTEAELERALQSGATLIGVNNRNLHTFETTLQTTFDLLPRVPPDVLLVSESGIETAEQVRALYQAGVR